MKLIFELGVEGRGMTLMPECDVPEYQLPEERSEALHLPHVSENELTRHYTALCKRIHGVNDGFYPLGSCTMKYNPKIDEDMAALAGFTQLHPLQPIETAQGALEVLHTLGTELGEVFGMDAGTFQPAAGAHGEFTGVLLIKAYHADRGDTARTKIIVPDSAHGTNPATAAMCGVQVINIPSGADGCVDLDALRAAVGPDTAGLMLTNPNTVGIFDKNILEITKIIHDAGGLCYYDGANLNAVMGVVRPGDMGFDCIHSNLHKTFATPHGGGGPGAGAGGCKEFLKKYMPGPLVVEKDGKYGFEYPEKSIGRVKMFYGNFSVVVRALTYVLTLGRDGIREAAMNAVLNANYMRVKLKDTFTMAYDEICMHEFVMSLVDLHKDTGVSALDLAKGMLDYGLHPPTMYFPLIVHEALMVEPCETESKETMDEVCDIYRQLFALAHSDPEALHTVHGTEILKNFLYNICGLSPEWSMANYVSEAIEEVRAKVGSGKVLLALSGGVDSSVVAALLAEAVGPQLTCVFVDHGLMRLNEGDEVESAFDKWDINFVRVNAEGRFLSKLAGISDPERKRKIIGEEFIRVFEEESKKIGAVDFLAQGTIYPDVIESGLGNAAVIKSHHNVGGLPDYVDFKEIIEPLRLLFKDEVRQLGRELGLPEYLVSRQPFPGPGLAIRIMGEITKEKADTLRLADAIYREELEKAGENKKMNQYFAVLTDTRTVGVMGDGRSYDRVLALRAVTTEDFMTADWARIPYELLDKISGRIVNEVKGISRIVYDITSTPPATVEWQ